MVFEVFVVRVKKKKKKKMPLPENLCPDIQIQPQLGQAIDAAIEVSMSRFNTMMENKFEALVGVISQQTNTRVQDAVKKAKRETFVCKRKGNQQQMDHCSQVLDKFESATECLNAEKIDEAVSQLQEGTELVKKRIKTIKLDDKSEFGWATVNEYLSDELASDTDDEKRMYRSEKSAEKKIKERQRLRIEKMSKVRQANPPRTYASSSTTRKFKLGPCFKISILNFFIILRFTCFVHLRACIESLAPTNNNILHIYILSLCVFNSVDKCRIIKYLRYAV